MHEICTDANTFCGGKKTVLTLKFMLYVCMDSDKTHGVYTSKILKFYIVQTIFISFFFLVYVNRQKVYSFAKSILSNNNKREKNCQMKKSSQWKTHRKREKRNKGTKANIHK